MIIKYEIEAFCKEIEAKLDTLSDKAYDNAKNKLAVLNRINIEFMEYEDLMRKSAVKFLELKGNWLKQKGGRSLKEHVMKILYKRLRIPHQRPKRVLANVHKGK